MPEGLSKLAEGSSHLDANLVGVENRLARVVAKLNAAKTRLSATGQNMSLVAAQRSCADTNKSLEHLAEGLSDVAATCNRLELNCCSELEAAADRVLAMLSNLSNDAIKRLDINAVGNQAQQALANQSANILRR